MNDCEHREHKNLVCISCGVHLDAKCEKCKRLMFMPKSFADLCYDCS